MEDFTIQIMMVRHGTDISDGLQISQFYRSGVSQTNSDLIISGAQDNGTLLMNGFNFWSAVRGGDGMECAIDPTNPNIMYSTVYYGALSKSNNGGDSWNDIAPASDGAWVTPFTLDPSNPNRIVAGYKRFGKVMMEEIAGILLPTDKLEVQLMRLLLQNLMEMLFIFPSIMKYL